MMPETLEEQGEVSAALMTHMGFLKCNTYSGKAIMNSWGRVEGNDEKIKDRGERSGRF